MRDEKADKSKLDLQKKVSHPECNVQELREEKQENATQLKSIISELQSPHLRYNPCTPQILMSTNVRTVIEPIAG